MALGLAFQITDDLLDVRSTTEVLGKPVGSDAKNGKKTVLTFMSEEQAEKEALELSQYAQNIFEGYPGSDIICALPMYLFSRNK